VRVLLVDQIYRVNYKYTAPLANALRNLGVEVTVVGDCRSVPKSEDDALPLFNTSHKDVSKISKAMNYVGAWNTILKTVRQEAYDVVHVQWFQLSPVDAWFISRLKRIGVRVVVTVHDILPFDEKPYDRHFLRRIYGTADWVIVQAEANRARFLQLFPEDGKKLRVIPHGHFLDYVEPADREAARERLGVPEGRTTALFFGQIKHVKGVDVLLRAFARYVERYGDDQYLIVAGNCWKTDIGDYQSIIRENERQLDGNLLFDARYIPDEEVPDYFAASDYCVLPYRDIYQSGVIQLCYAYKKPVTASDLPPFREIVEDGRNGFICPVDDAEGLVNAMRRARETSNLKALGAEGYQKVRSLYSWDKIAGQIEALYMQ